MNKKDVHSIAVVDDNPENTQAAQRAFAETLPATKVSVFHSASEFLEYIDGDPREFDLVLSDMSMEERYSGRTVAYATWRWRVPTMIVSGGVDHGRETFRVGHRVSACFSGTKATPEAWDEIISWLFAQGENDAILISLKFGKTDNPDDGLAYVGSIGCSLAFN